MDAGPSRQSYTVEYVNLNKHRQNQSSTVIIRYPYSVNIAKFLVSGGDNTCKVQNPTFQGEKLKPVLNWLCLAMTLLEALF
jgi:hypothetical protein